jgi:hypothetical protein
MEKLLFMSQLVDVNCLPPGSFYVIEVFPDPCFVTDEEGDAKVFETYSEAAVEAADCQEGYVIQL